MGRAVFRFNGVDQYATIPDWTPNGLPFSVEVEAVGLTPMGSDMYVFDSASPSDATALYFPQAASQVYFRYRDTTAVSRQVLANDWIEGEAREIVATATADSTVLSTEVGDSSLGPVAGPLSNNIDVIGTFRNLAAGFFHGPIYNLKLTDNSPIQDTDACFGDANRYAQLENPIVLEGDFEITVEGIFGENAQTWEFMGDADTTTFLGWYSKANADSDRLLLWADGGVINSFEAGMDNIATGQHFAQTLRRVGSTYTVETDGVETDNQVAALKTLTISNLTAARGIAGRYMPTGSALQNIIIRDLTNNLSWEYKLDEGEGTDAFNTDPSTQGNYNNLPMYDTDVLEGDGARYIEIPEFVIPAGDDFRITWDEIHVAGAVTRQMGGGSNSVLFAPAANNQYGYQEETDALHVFLNGPTLTTGQHIRREVTRIGGTVNAFTDGQAYSNPIARNGELIIDRLMAWPSDTLNDGMSIQNVTLENLTTGEYVQYKIDEGSGTVIKAYDRNGSEIPEYGPQLVKNNNFTEGSDGLRDWDYSNGNPDVQSNVSGGVLTISRPVAGGVTESPQQTLDMEIGERFRVTVVTGDSTAGNLAVRVGSTVNAAVPPNSTTVFEAERTDSQDNIKLWPASAPADVEVISVDVERIQHGVVTPDASWATIPEYSNDGAWAPDVDWQFVPYNSRYYPMGEQTGTEFKCYRPDNGSRLEPLDATIVNPTSTGGGWDVLPPGGYGSGPGLQLNDEEYRYLGGLGFTGALPDRRYAFFLQYGYRTWRSVYEFNGGTGQLNDWLMTFFAADNPPVPGPEEGGGPTPSGPAWEAGTADLTTYEMLAQRIGEGTPTFTHTGLLLPDYEGVYRDIPANTAPWHGARIVTNHMPWSEDAVSGEITGNNPGWRAIGAASIDSAQQVTIGPTTGDQIRLYVDDYGSAPLDVYTRFTFKATIPSGRQVELVPFNGGSTTFTGDGTEKIYSIVSSGVHTTPNVICYIRPVSADTGTPIAIPFSYVHIEYINPQDLATAQPGEYVKTDSFDAAVGAYASRNGNTVDPVTDEVSEAVGPPIAELPSLFAAPAATNLCLHSNNLADAAWTATIATNAFDQIGITGEPNTASGLAATGTQSAFQAVTITNDSGDIVFRYFVKKEGGDSIELGYQASGATSYAAFDVGTGVLSGGYDDSAVDSVGDWWVVYMQTTKTATIAYPAVRLNSGEACVIGNCGLYEDTTIAQIRGASPIITAGATGSTSAVEIEYDLANHDDTQGAYYAEVNAVANEYPLSVGTANASRIMDYQAATNFRSRNSGGTITQNTLVDNVYQKHGVIYDQSLGDWGINTDGGTWEEASTYTTYNSNQPNLAAFRTAQKTALIRNIQRWDLAYDDAKARVDELMSTPSWPPALPAPEIDPTLVWAAASDSYTYSENGGGDYEMKAQGIGSGSPTFTHTGLLLPDHTGRYVSIPANTAPWHGARIVTNIATESADLTAAAWQDNIDVTGGVTDPDGGSTAFLLSNTATIGYIRTANITTVGQEAVTSWWVRRVTGTGQVHLYNGDANNIYEITNELTTEWQRFAGPPTTVATTGRCGIRLSVNGDEVEVWHPQMEQVAGQSNQNPSEYVETGATAAVAAYNSTLGNTVSNNVVQENIGVPLDELPSLYAAPAATNLMLYSNDLAQAGSWAVNGVTAAYDQIGITGEPNTASRIEATTTTNARASQAITLTATGSQVFRFIAKASTGNAWLRPSSSGFDVTASTYFDLANGVVGDTSGTDATAIDDLGNGWYACYQEFTTTGLSGSNRLYVTDGNSSPNVTVGNAVIVGNVEVYSDTTIAQIRGASPIITAGSTVSTSDCFRFSYDTANAAVDGGWYAELKTFTNQYDYRLITYGSNVNIRTPLSADWNGPNTSQFAKIGMNGASTNSAGTTTNPPEWRKFGSANEESLTQGARTEDDTWVERAWTATNTITECSVATASGNQANPPASPILVRNIRRYDLSYTAAKAKIDELMGGS